MPSIAQEKVDALQTLGVAASASEAEIREAWRTLAFKTHPDRCNGSDTEFVRINSAYELLRKHGHTPLERPTRSRRPSIQTRIVDLSPDVETLCREQLVEEGAVGAGVAEHVASAVRRKGRRLSYIIRTPLSEGSNRVALPTGELEDNRKVKPQVVTFTSDKTGSGQVVVPEGLRETMFPGARSVRILFEAED
ncbi:MAG: DnaJ domain-containing protein [Pseudomonadota bacterium]